MIVANALALLGVGFIVAGGWLILKFLPDAMLWWFA